MVKRMNASIWPRLNLRCPVPEFLEDVTDIGGEDEPDGVHSDEIAAVWQATEKFYRAGAHPAVALCIRHNGRRVLNRTLGFASGGGPEDEPEGDKRRLKVDMPVGIFSASKAISAMVIHKLDEENVLRLDDPICDFIPEFARHGKHRMTLRHVLSHRAGVPNLPPGRHGSRSVGSTRRSCEVAL